MVVKTCLMPLPPILQAASAKERTRLSFRYAASIALAYVAILRLLHHETRAQWESAKTHPDAPLPLCPRSLGPGAPRAHSAGVPEVTRRNFHTRSKRVPNEWHGGWWVQGPHSSTGRAQRLPLKTSALVWMHRHGHNSGLERLYRVATNLTPFSPSSASMTIALRCFCAKRAESNARKFT